MTTPAAPEQRLTDVIERRTRADGLRRRLEDAKAQARESTARAQSAEEKAGAEAADVERLEHMSWTRILSSLRGSHASDVEREQAEAEAARYAAATERNRAEADQREVDALNAQLRDLGDVEADYAAALDAKERWIREQGSSTAARLAEIAEEQGQLAAQARETDEAVQAGRTAIKHLTGALSLLESASSWAAWDTFGGGGMFTDMVKHQKMEDAQTQLSAADQALKVFNRELADVSRSVAGGLRTSNFDLAFDMWFDNIFSDLAVRRRIHDARDAVASTLENVRTALASLEKSQQDVAQRRTALAGEREQLLTA